MADKFCDPSLTTGLNDGTSKANAWQSFEQVWSNTITAGVINSGDIIYVRTQNAGVDITENIALGLTCAIPASVDLPTRVIMDDGTVWAGDAGMLTLDCGATARTFKPKANVPLEAGGTNYRLRVYYGGGTNNSTMLTTGSDLPYCNGLWLHWPNKVGENNCTGMCGTFSNLKITVGSSRIGYWFMGFNSELGTRFNNLIVEVNTLLNGNCYLFSMPQRGGIVTLYGGKIIGAGAPDYYLTVEKGYPDHLRVIDFDYSQIRQEVLRTTTIYSNAFEDQVLFNGNGNKPFDFWYKNIAIVYFNTGEAYPYLSSLLPGGEGWSYKVYPHESGRGMPFSMLPIQKVYTAASATRTLEMNFLINTAFNTGQLYYTGTAMQTGEIITGSLSGATGVVDGDSGTYLTVSKVNGVFKEGETITGGVSGNTATTTSNLEGVHCGTVSALITYVDNASGDTKTIALDKWGEPLIEGSGWNNTNYGNKSYNAYKLQTTTAFAIRQNTRVNVHLIFAIRKVLNDDFYFIDPDVIVT